MQHPDGLDRHVDLVLAYHDLDTVAILYGVGDGTFAAPRDYLVGDGPTALAVGDLEPDGHPDVVIAHDIDQTVRVLAGTCP